MRTNKKGITLGQLVPVIVILVIAVVVLTVGLRVTSETRDKLITKTGATTSVVNSTNATSLDDSLTFVLANADIASIVNINNATGGEPVIAANYTATIGIGRQGSITMTGNEYNTTGINVTYTYYTKTPLFNGANDSMGGLFEIASWSDLIGLVIAAAIILGLVMGAIALKAGRE